MGIEDIDTWSDTAHIPTQRHSLQTQNQLDLPQGPQEPAQAQELVQEEV